MLALRRAWPWVLVVPILLWALVRWWGLERGPIVAAMPFTPWVALGSVLVLVLVAALRRWWPAGVAAVACLILAVAVLPRGFGGPTGGEGDALVLASVNLRRGGADAAELVALVRERHIDVLALQELTKAELDKLEAAGLRDELPYAEADPKANSAGTAVFSRVEPTDAGLRAQQSGHFPQAWLEVNGIVFESVHVFAPANLDASYNLGADVNTKMDNLWAGGLRQVGGARDGRVLVGDFNSTLDQSEFRDLISDGYRDAADEVGAGFVFTWPYTGRRALVIPKITVDHVLVPPSLGVRDFAAEAITGADHRMIITTLTLSRS